MINNHKLTGLIAIVPRTGFVYIEDLEVSRDLRHCYYGSTLVAFACYMSLKYQDDGYVSLLSKTNTKPFYKKLGASFISDQNCYFSGIVARKLIKEYRPKGGFIIE